MSVRAAVVPSPTTFAITATITIPSANEAVVVDVVVDVNGDGDVDGEGPRLRQLIGDQSPLTCDRLYR
jgi:hypothetical protein